MTGARPVMLTGDRPTGPLHLGHLAGSLENRLLLQDTHRCFVLIADLQMLTDRVQLAPELPSLTRQLMRDYLSVGLDPARVVFVLQSGVPELAELTALLSNFVSYSQVASNPTVRLEIRERNLEKSVPFAFIAYPLSQAADILGFQADVVPVGSDQLPMIELTKQVRKRFHALFGVAFAEPQPVLSKAARLPGLDGKSKASKSLNNAIFLRDSPSEVEAKVQRMFTDPDHLKASDPGRTEGNVVFDYLRAFGPDEDEVLALAHRYEAGGLGDSVVKKRLGVILNERLAPIREQGQRLAGEDAYLDTLLADGTAVAREVVAQTLDQVRGRMGLRP